MVWRRFLIEDLFILEKLANLTSAANKLCIGLL